MAADTKDLPALPGNVSHVMRRIRACESEVPAQLVLEHALHAYAREAVAAYREQQAGGLPADCDVRKILLEVVPGDGDGLEVFAKNVADVEALFSKMGAELEEWELGIRRLPALSPNEAQPVVPMTSKEAIAGWHASTDAHKRLFAFEWFSAGILFAEQHHGIVTKESSTLGDSPCGG